MNKFMNWIKNGNNCERCKYSWCEKTSYEYDEWECGCFIKGDRWEEKPCRLLPLFKNIIGFFRKRKTEYAENHMYDGYGEFSEKEYELDEKFKSLVYQYMDMERLYLKFPNDTYHKVKNCDDFYYFWKIRSEYEEFAHPFVNKSLHTEWKELILKTFNRFVNKFKPYFCK